MSSNLLQLNSNRNYPGFTFQTISPNSTHNSTTGFNVGNIWVNSTNGSSYILADAVTPVWHVISSNNVQLNLTAIVDPASTNDNTPGGGGYSIGSIWINTSDNSVWMATKVTAPAIWMRLSDIKNNFSAIIDPTISDNSAAGFNVGSRWVNTITGKLWTLVKIVGAVATWSTSADSIVQTSPVAPTASDDLASGFPIGDIWIDTATNEAYVSTKDSPVGTAIWKRIDPVASTLNNFGAVVDPAIANDSGTGYSPGSIWVNTATRKMFIAESVAVGAAVWVPVFETKNNFTAVVAPTSTDNSSSGSDYIVGSRWVNTLTNTLFTLVDVTGLVATWAASGSATVAATFPTGPTLGQLFHNTTNDLTYVWDGFAWIDISAAGGAFVKNNFTATTNPLPSNDSSVLQGYDVGSVWVNTSLGIVWTATNVGIGVAVWTSGGGGATVAAVPPTTPLNGDFWYDTANDLVFIWNGSAWIDIVAAGISNPNWIVLIAAHAAVNGEHLALDSTGGAFTVTLPLAPSPNDTVFFTDVGSSMQTNNVIIARNGSSIQGLAQDLIINTNGMVFTLSFIGGGWRLA